MTLAIETANRLGFTLLGLTNNFAYVIMLSAAYDLLNPKTTTTATTDATLPTIANSSDILLTATVSNETQKSYCNPHSTSTILLADTLPSLTTKIIYPFLLVGLPTAWKAIGTALLAALAFIITGFSASQLLIFTGVICASFSSGLGESTFLSNTPLYGDVSLSGWSIGTGAAGLLGSMAYAVLRILLPIKLIMMVMLVVPVVMIVAFFYIIRPIADEPPGTQPVGNNLTPIARPMKDARRGSTRSYGSNNGDRSEQQSNNHSSSQDVLAENNDNNATSPVAFGLHAKILTLPSLAKYFLPLLLVYFAEYFINQGLFEIIYYPEITYLNHAAQYSWFQVSYQLGVLISRSSLDLLRIKNIWTMSLLQAANAILFLAHASKLIHIPSFYLVIILIIYEGLLGGFTYVNTFYRVKKEVPWDKQEFCISTVTMADSLGIVMAGLLALPVHDALCKLYT